MHYDTHDTLALSGIKHYQALGETPPGFSDKDKQNVKKSYYYLNTMATMQPVFQKQLGVATAVGATGILSAFVTGGLSLIATGAAVIGGMAAAAGTENCVMETTAWWTKSRKARDEFIARAMVGSDVKELLQKAARRMDSVVANVKSRQARSAARARAYFVDFIAIGDQKKLKSQLNQAQQAAFGAAFLDCLVKGKRVADCMLVGANAATVCANRQAKSERNRARVLSAKAQAKARRDVAMAAARAKAKAEMELNALRAKIPSGQSPTTMPAPFRAQLIQAQTQVQVAATAVQQADAAVVAADQAVSQATAQQTQDVVQETQEAVTQASADVAQSSAEDAAVEAANPQAAAAETAAVAAGASPEAAVAAGEAVASGTAPSAAATDAVAQTASGADSDEGKKGGLPIVPILAVAGIAAFLLMRKK